MESAGPNDVVVLGLPESCELHFQAGERYSSPRRLGQCTFFCALTNRGRKVIQCNRCDSHCGSSSDSQEESLFAPLSQYIFSDPWQKPKNNIYFTVKLEKLPFFAHNVWWRSPACKCGSCRKCPQQNSQIHWWEQTPVAWTALFAGAMVGVSLPARVAKSRADLGYSLPLARDCHGRTHPPSKSRFSSKQMSTNDKSTCVHKKLY